MPIRTEKFFYEDTPSKEQDPVRQLLYRVERESRKPSLINVTNTPDLIKRHRNWKPEEVAYFAYFFRTISPELSAMLKTGIDAFSFQDLVERQMRISFPSTEVAAMSLADVDKGDNRVQVVRFRQREAAASRLPQRPQPDFKEGFLTKDADQSVNEALALKTVLAVINTQDVANLGELLETWEINYFELLLGLRDLATHRVQSQFAKAGQQKLLSSPHFTEAYAEWLSFVSVKATQRNVTNFFPLPFDPTITSERNYPTLRFLPSVLEAYLLFLLELPFAVQAGEEFNLGRLRVISQSIFSDLDTQEPGFVDSALRAERKAGRATPQEIRDAQPVIEDFMEEIKQVMNFFLDNPGLVNRARSPEHSEDTLVRYDQLRQEIIDSGGKAPRSRKIRFSFGM